MYKNILVPIDNSDYSNTGIDIGIKIAQHAGAKLTGNHVYAARLHDVRFRQMESGLPEKYLKEKELEKQRDVHDSLITKGLEIITDSYLDFFEKKCVQANMKNFEKRSLEGKNYKEIVKDVEKNKCDLVIIGALGLGTVKESVIGSVCERVVRRVNVDTLVIKDTAPLNGGNIVVAVDGSPQSFGGLLTGIELGKFFNKKIAVISAFDPYFHYVAFNSIAGVLSDEAGKIFKFKEQEKLHEEIIDSGLAKIYQAYLDISKQVAGKQKVKIDTKLLAGKAFEEILKYVKEEKPWMLIIGKVGIHCDDDMDIGSNTENILRKVNCHLLVSSRKFTPSIEETAKVNIVWTKEAEKRMEKVPAFARGMAKIAILRFATEQGNTVITANVIDRATERLLPESARNAMGIISKEAVKKKVEREKKEKAIAHPGKKQGEDQVAFDGKKLTWGKKALKSLEKVPEGFMRNNVKLRIEKYARTKEMDFVPEEIVSQNLDVGKKRMRGMVDMISKMPGEREDERQKSESEETFQWTEDARARLESVPEGFMRDMTKWRIEAFVRKSGSLKVTEELIEQQYQYWAEGSKKVEKELRWDKEAKIKVEKIPPFIRGMVIKEIENEAKKRGENTVTSETLSSVRNKWSDTMEFHSEFPKD